jgi:hypothetical protein
MDFLCMMNLSPISAYVDGSYGGYYRVPVYRNEDEHVVFVGDNHKRMFTSDTLPDFIKLKLSMICASATPELLIDDDRAEIDSLAMTLYLVVPKEGFEAIGWQLTKRYFVVILKEEELDGLRGDTGS